MTAIKTSTIAPKVYEKTDPVHAAPAQAVPVDTDVVNDAAPLDAFTVSELVNTLNEMKAIQEKTQRGEIKLGDDEGLLADLQFHISELSDTLNSLEQSVKNK